MRNYIILHALNAGSNVMRKVRDRQARQDRGQNMLEYVGLVIIVAGVIGLLATQLDQIVEPFTTAVNSVTSDVTKKD